MDIYAEPIPFINGLPGNGSLGYAEGEAVFDEAVHLSVIQPEYLIGLDYKKYPFPLSTEDKKRFPGLSVSAPFRVLSDEGVRVLHSIYEKNKDNKSGFARQAFSIRGLAYRSKFIRDLNHSPLLMKLFSAMANEPLTYGTLPMNYSQINVGAIGDDKAVDQWHIDSVAYVMVVIISDLKGMIGGELEVIMHPHETAFDMLLNKSVTPNDIITADYKEQGYCMFMQGSKMVHHVKPVKKANEPRLSLVNSYESANATKPDVTRFDTFARGGDPEHQIINEFARHKAWRAQAVLKHIINSTQPSSNPKDTVAQLERAAIELKAAVDIVSGRKYDGIGYFDESAGKQIKYVDEKRDKPIKSAL